MEVATNTPALFTHCETVYKAMLAKSVEAVFEDVSCRVYEGAGTKLFGELGLSVPYYSNVMTALKGMDCVRQLRRGGGGAPSQWLLLQPPTRELFAGLPDASEKGLQAAQEQQRYNDLNRRIAKLEKAVFDREGGSLDRPA